EVREIMAELGVRRFQDLIGRSDFLCKQGVINHWKAKNIDLSKILWTPKSLSNDEIYNSSKQDHNLVNLLDQKVIKKSKKVIDGEISSIQINTMIKNTDRSFGAMLSGEIATRYGHKGLNEDSIVINLVGTAGQSFGTFLSKGVTLNLNGEANDYVGKGLSGGRITIKPFDESKLDPDKNIIVGNTVLYGAISGECYFSGVAGERFAVRNSGAIAVVEGTGDHCCEYMTGGIVMVLGDTGINFGAGMSGGIAYVYDENKKFQKRCNFSMVEITQLQESSKPEKRNIFNKYSFLENDKTRIKEMLEKHLSYTNSPKASKILKNFNKEINNFVKVLPIDFKNAIEKTKIEKIESKGSDVWQK
ncbi:MAG: glutamate synthase subunit alpha, partial [Rickettsiales bacterium]|nr:glutamate synthase subunit alpha [Rickettsiales bacterium]